MSDLEKKHIAILGSTGSIGKQALEVARHLGYPVVALAAHSNIDLLQEQIHLFHPELVAVADEEKAKELKKRIPFLEVVPGKEGLERVASHPKADLVVSAITGFAGIAPTIAAIKQKKQIALANKEVLVAAGGYVMQLAQHYGVDVLPVDSEHNAIFQCLQGEKKQEIQRLILTASGGPFFHFEEEKMACITPLQALSHPTWKMGPKVTIDSSTLMNKGLEVIEAYHLFQMPAHQIEVVVHPQSVVHSMVEMVDGSVFALLSEPDMRLPIQHTMTYPKRLAGIRNPFPFNKYPKLEFFTPQKGKFLCLDLAYTALKEGGSFPCYLNAANEVLVSRFLKNEIGWLDIGRRLERLLTKHQNEKTLSLETIYAVDESARIEAQTI